jgi:hypothetical protein
VPVTNANFAFIGYGPEAEDIDKDQSPWRVFVPDNFLFSFIHDVDSVQSGVLSKLAGCENRRCDQQNPFAALAHYRRVVYALRFVFALLSGFGLSYP